jgi:DNA-directed RNA polymerase specialized sigma24 family protein
MAHDISQETWIALNNRYQHVEDETELVKLCFGISRHIYCRMKQRHGREELAPEEWNPVADDASAEDLAYYEQVRVAIKALTGRCTEVLLLELEGYTADEIKARMGAGRTSTVYVWIHRCHAALRRKLGLRGEE